MAKEAPVLTKAQQKNSLRAKKTKTKAVVRNVLASPYSKYWPKITAEEATTLREILTNNLPKIVVSMEKIPWKEYKKISKSKRKPQNQKNDQELIAEKKQGLIFGVNDVTKALEKASVASVLITEDVQPRLMVEHLIEQSVLTLTPILVVPKLREILKTVCGFSSITIAFTKLKKYPMIQQVIENIYKNHPVPRNYIHFQKYLDTVNSSIIVIDDTLRDDDSVIYLDDTIGNDESKIKSFYLYRDSKQQRAFVPEKSSVPLEKHTFQSNSEDFVAFNVDNVNNEMPMQYECLKVKKTKGDSNRNKRKLDVIKTKKKGNKISKVKKKGFINNT
ncbi:hypothetical protein ABEB36_009725 [Hypothenemus hampei]|uniref:Ribosomal protein eL8/eL30/eS12/Gadd45 domain-containing protein n=1 Tax=Hypothenemus hampei TaxID=57062 RepID=A0ABD1EHD2_HYPHA